MHRAASTVQPGLDAYPMYAGLISDSRWTHFRRLSEIHFVCAKAVRLLRCCSAPDLPTSYGDTLPYRL